MEAPLPHALATVNLPAIGGYELLEAVLRRHRVVRKLKYLVEGRLPQGGWGRGSAPPALYQGLQAPAGRSQ